MIVPQDNLRLNAGVGAALISVEQGPVSCQQGRGKDHSGDGMSPGIQA